MRRITAQLRREGLLVNHKAVARHMREMGLAALCPGPNLSKRAQQAGIYPYLLRHVRAERPNHIWGIEAAREQLIVELQAALANIKTLRGLLPICAWCKQVRDDQGYWTQVEVYIRDHSEVEFSHGICPACLHKLDPDLLETDER